MRPSDNLDNKTLSHILNSLTSMYEISGSQFFRTTTGIQSGPGCSRWIKVRYDLFNHLGSYKNIMQFQVSSRRKNRQRDIQFIKIRVLRKVFSKQLGFIRCKIQHVWVIEQRKYGRFTVVENTISNLPKVPRTKFLWVFGLFGSFSICKFGSFKNRFATINSLFELYFRFRRFILLVQTKKKKKILWTVAAAQEAKNHGNEWGLTWYSQNSLAAAEALSLKISSHGTSLKWSRRPSQSARE